MKKLSEQTRKNIKNALLFPLGVIVTIIITKTFDKAIPNEPILVKEYTDTIKIVHEYKIPKELNDDSTRIELVKKINNLELLNDYDRIIKEKINFSKKSDGIIPNLILTGNENRIKSKGYIYGSSSAYFTSNCPDLKKDFLDIKLDFFNPKIIEKIAFLRVNIYRFEKRNSTEVRAFVLEELYEVKQENNLIRISNDFSNGKYEIMYGFIFKKELETKYPSFNFKKCTVTKE